MRKVETWKRWTFIASLAAIAFLIHNSKTPREGGFHTSALHSEGSASDLARLKAAIEERAVQRKRAEEMAAKRQRYLGRDLTSRAPRKPGVEIIGITIMSENRTLNGSLATSMASHLQSETVRVLASLFTPTFVSDGMFDTTFVDSYTTVQELELTNVLDVIWLGRQTVQFSTNAALEDVITANMQMELLVVPVEAPDQKRTRTLAAKGAGFNNEDARLHAEERLIGQIATNTAWLQVSSGGSF